MSVCDVGRVQEVSQVKRNSELVRTYRKPPQTYQKKTLSDYRAQGDSNCYSGCAKFRVNSVYSRFLFLKSLPFLGFFGSLFSPSLVVSLCISFGLFCAFLGLCFRPDSRFHYVFPRGCTMYFQGNSCVPKVCPLVCLISIINTLWVSTFEQGNISRLIC